MSTTNLTPDQQIAYNILTKVYMSTGKNLLQAQLEFLAKTRDDIEAAVQQIKADWEAGKL